MLGGAAGRVRLILPVQVGAVDEGVDLLACAQSADVRNVHARGTNNSPHTSHRNRGRGGSKVNLLRSHRRIKDGLEGFTVEFKIFQ